MRIQSLRDEDLRRRFRLRRRWWRFKRRALDESPPGQGIHLRAVRWWLYGGDPPARELLPVRLARRVARRPRARVIVPWAWAAEGLRLNAKLVNQLVRQSEQDRRPARAAGVPWQYGPCGIGFIDPEAREGISYQTVANNVRAIADALDEAARWDRRDRERHD